jgi:hypothetical protein
VSSDPAPDAPEIRAERLRVGRRALGACVTVAVVWLYLLNLVVHGYGPLGSFFRLMDSLTDLVLGSLAVVVVGVSILVMYTLTTLFTQMITNLNSARILEDLLREELFRGRVRRFFIRLIRFNEIPAPVCPFPSGFTSTVLVLAFHYLVAWFYLVVFSECLYFAAWSAGVYLDLYPESMNTVPLFAVAIPFTARLMAFLRFPWAESYAGFIPGILFVVMLLLAFVGAMGGPFMFYVVDIYNREEPGYFLKGALFWKFLRDGAQIAFYPVLGEIAFLFLQYHRFAREADAEASPPAPPPAAP